MHLNQNEVTLIYNGNDDKGKKTLACALSLNKKINKQDITSVRVSDTLFGLVLDLLEEEARKVFNRADPFYQEHMRGKRLNNSEYLEYLKRRPELLSSPIAMYRNKVVVCRTPTDVYKVLTGLPPEK